MSSVISFYSYKGGTGRTTTCANVAFQIASFGKKVLCLDLDIDGPGLHAVFRIENSSDLETKNIVRYFSEETPNYRDFVHDLTKGPDYSLPSHLHVVPAIMSVNREDTLETMGSDLPARVKVLIDDVKKDYDYVIIDTASGVSDYSLLAFSISTHIVMCFKWSKQHVIGSLKVSTLLEKIKAANVEEYPLENWFLVPTSVSSPQDKYEEDRKKEVIDVVKQHLGMDIDFEIPENPRQKWDERIVVKENDLSNSYKELAELLSGKHSGSK